MKLWKLLLLGLREARGSQSRLILLACAIVFGTAAVVGTRSLQANLFSAIDTRARSLLGADLAISSRARLTPSQHALIGIEELQRANELRFRSVLYIEKTGTSKLVQVRALTGTYPLYGSVTTTPANAWQDLLSGKQTGVVLERRFAESLGLDQGSIVKSAGISLPVLGIIEEGLGEVRPSALFAPRVYVSHSAIPQDLLEGKGSIVEYVEYLRFSSALREQHFLEKLVPALNAQGLEVTTLAQRKESLGRSVENAQRFFAMVAVLALLLGSIGAGTGITQFLRAKVPLIGLLRSLGATRSAIVVVIGTQILLVGLLAATGGALLGALLQKGAAHVLSQLWNSPLDLRLYYSEILLGAAIGLCSLSAAAAPALVSLTQVTPLTVLRAGRDLQIQRTTLVLTSILGIGFTLAVAYLLLGSVIGAAVLTAALALLLAVLLLLGMLLRRLARAFSQRAGSFSLRFGIASLYRPENQTLSVVLVLGVLTLLLQVVNLSQGLLHSQLDTLQERNRPNSYLFDIPADQLPAIKRELAELSIELVQEAPVVLMRLSKVNGRPVADLARDPDSKIAKWVLTREYWVSYRGQLSENELILDGTWVPRVSPTATKIPISLEDGLLDRLAIGLGAELEFEVQGQLLTTFVRSKRDILWERLERNSMVLFPEGVLEDVPQYRILSLRVDGQEKASALAQRISDRYPTISLVDTASIIETVTKILGTIEQAITFLSLFLLGSGLLVFASAVVGSAESRLREGELLKTLGATRRIVRQVIVIEYSALALVALLAATPLALLCGWGLAKYVYKIPFSIPHLSFWGLSILMFASTLLAAQLLSWLARPLERARREK